MKKSSKVTVRALALGTVLAGGITLTQSFYNEAQASAWGCPCKDVRMPDGTTHKTCASAPVQGSACTCSAKCP